MKVRWSLSLILLGLCFYSMAYAGARSRVIAIDEFGNGIGTLSRGFMLPDPGPGGLPSVLTYILPFQGTAGDVTFGVEPGLVFGGDIIRFNGNGTVIFYSDNVPNPDSPADTIAPPSQLYPNRADVQEIENTVAFYTPSPGQPGWDRRNPTYIFISDGMLPERQARH
jgi:hypothetical protein